MLTIMLTVEGGTWGSKTQRTWEPASFTDHTNWWITEEACQCMNSSQFLYHCITVQHLAMC